MKCYTSWCDQRGQESSANVSPLLCLLWRAPGFTPPPLLCARLRALPPASLDQWLHFLPTSLSHSLSLSSCKDQQRKKREAPFSPLLLQPAPSVLSDSRSRPPGRQRGLLTLLASGWMGSSRTVQEWWRLCLHSYWNLFCKEETN